MSETDIHDKWPRAGLNNTNLTGCQPTAGLHSKTVMTIKSGVEDLPPELLAQLSGVKKTEIERRLLDIFDQPMTIDWVLITLYRRYKMVFTRRYIQHRLWRFCKEGKLVTIAGRKGVYARPVHLTPSQQDLEP